MFPCIRHQWLFFLTRSWTFASHPTWSLGSQPLGPLWMSNLNMDPEYLSTQVLKALLWTCPLIRRAAMFTRLILSGGDKIHSQEVHFELLWSFLSPKNYVNDVFIASDEVHHLCVKIYSQFYIYVVIQSQKITTLFCCVH